ncbi:MULTISPECIES: excinuclease ABC subunit UvrC [Thiorhodovibrio]|uniref:excinuclease ABC subunit UvrC n=1 Tax=Thiorhodovibrio TaxID=61593 RepID=UPI00191374D9|nr:MULTISPECIES: excinuclease ABC subunit UvrC [Thiorhodovibrio]MBK5970220.1 excinuclease ABC subunit C [Thiorhodovibrio winogradskyi]WPL12723.1 Excinuclease ABC subunit C [Thiorhodovibrio litoralis]
MLSDASRRALLARIPTQPGVYRMLDAEGGVLYVGKAKELKRRVSSYFSRSLNHRLQVMVAQIADVAVTVTRTEGEALLLEADLIKSHQPRFNVLLRDDKSYPFIYLSTQDRFPRLAFYRGSRKTKGRYFGPYPSASAVRETLQLLQKIFPVRQCRDTFFRNRSRPCLQYQIKRCTGPCVGLVSEQDYGEDVARTIKFLDGRTNEVIRELGERMDEAADALEFERAAVLRDQIATLRRIQQRQYVTAGGGDLDILAHASEGGLHCVQVFFIRAGHNLGNKSFFPKAPAEATPGTVMAGFLTQFYADKPIPPELLVSQAPEELEFLESAFAERAGRKVAISYRLRGERAQWLKMAQSNADLSLQSRLGSRAGYSQRLEALRDLLGLDELPARMECFDISHTQGELTVASCVVFDGEGPRKSDYRRFNIEGIAPGDDYAAMAQALERRYKRIKAGEVPVPDLLFIDGGRGQLNAAIGILEELGIHDVRLVGVAKGPDRKAGAEQLWQPHQRHALIAPADSPAMHLVQQIRDEAHRFAITGHRQRRDKARRTSVLEDIAGVGPKRRANLLKAFGGIRGLRSASAEDIARVDGISSALAEQIHQAVNQDSA